LNASMHGSCIICRGRVNRQGRGGRTLTRCQECQDAVEANRSKYLRLRRVYQSALEAIVAGADPVETARAALADDGLVEERKAA